MLRCFKAFAVTAILVLLLGLLVAFLTARTASPDRRGENRSDRETPELEVGDGTLIDDLTRSGWAAEAARAVVETNREWFGIQREEDPARYKHQVTSLLRLGRHPELGGFLTAHPGAAGLLAEAEDPTRMAASFPELESDYLLIADFYIQHPTPADAAQLAEALARHRDAIIELRRRGLISAEVIFMFDRDTPAVDAYDLWLREALEGLEEWSEDQLSSFVNLAMRHGPELRKRMVDSPEFSSQFREDLWPKMTRIAARNGNMFEKYLDDVRVWDLLSLDQGEQLLDGSGLLAVDLSTATERSVTTRIPRDCVNAS
jgi:hypothetical protein